MNHSTRKIGGHYELHKMDYSDQREREREREREEKLSLQTMNDSSIDVVYTKMAGLSKWYLRKQYIVKF